jgi:hypothetical protein
MMIVTQADDLEKRRDEFFPARPQFEARIRASLARQQAMDMISGSNNIRKWIIAFRELPSYQKQRRDRAPARPASPAA